MNTDEKDLELREENGTATGLNKNHKNKLKIKIN